MRFQTAPTVVNATATAGVATATHTGVTGSTWRAAWVTASYTDTPTQVGTLTILDNASSPVTLFKHSFSGSFSFNFGEHMPAATKSKNLVATLTAGAGGIVGLVSLAAYKGQ